MQFRHIVLAAGLAAAASLQAANVTFTVNYTDGAGEGFNDPTLGTARKSSFQYALNVWGGFLQANYAGETVRVNASFDSLGGSPSSATLGQAGSTWMRRDFGSSNPAYQSGTWYGDPLANHLRGNDLSASEPEITAQFNSDVDGGTVLGATNWYYGTNGVPGGHIDFVTVVLHEVGHGLGFSSMMTPGSGAYAGGFPSIYDRKLVNGSGVALTGMTDAQRAAASTSSNIFWDGQYGKAANGGVRPEIYAPNPYESGSSISHLDEAGAYANELMSPMYSGPDHTPSTIELGILRDMGWSVPEPGAIALLLVSGGTLTLRRRRGAA